MSHPAVTVVNPFFRVTVYSMFPIRPPYSSPPSRSGWQLSVAQRYLCAASETLLSVFRCLRFVLYPCLVSLVLLCVLYSVAEYQFTDWYFGVYGYAWKLAFPWSWRLLFLLLCTVPAFSCLHILRLLVLAQWRRSRYNSHSSPSQEYTMLSWNESDSLEERELSGARDDENCGLEDIEGDAGSSLLRLPLQRRAPTHLMPSNWFLEFILWLVILCISLWALLHRHPGDLRCLPLIEKANAHPNRTGYANQGEYYDPSLCPRSTSLTDL